MGKSKRFILFVAGLAVVTFAGLWALGPLSGVWPHLAHDRVSACTPEQLRIAQSAPHRVTGVGSEETSSNLRGVTLLNPGQASDGPALSADQLGALLNSTPLKAIYDYANQRQKREADARNGGFFEFVDWSSSDELSRKQREERTRNHLMPLIEDIERNGWPKSTGENGQELPDDAIYYLSSVQMQLPKTDQRWKVLTSVSIFHDLKNTPAKTMRNEPGLVSVMYHFYSEDAPKPNLRYFIIHFQLYGTAERDSKAYGLNSPGPSHSRGTESDHYSDIDEIALPLPWAAGSSEGFVYSRSQKKWITITFEPWSRISEAQSEQISREYQANYVPRSAN